jgi:hypothetical protein
MTGRRRHCVLPSTAPRTDCRSAAAGRVGKLDAKATTWRECSHAPRSVKQQTDIQRPELWHLASFRTFLRCVCVRACVRACVCVWRGTSDPMRALSSMVGTPCGVLWVRERLQSEPASSALTEAISKFSRSSLAFQAPQHMTTSNMPRRSRPN